MRKGYEWILYSEFPDEYIDKFNGTNIDIDSTVFVLTLDLTTFKLQREFNGLTKIPAPEWSIRPEKLNLNYRTLKAAVIVSIVTYNMILLNYLL